MNFMLQPLKVATTAMMLAVTFSSAASAQDLLSVKAAAPAEQLHPAVQTIKNAMENFAAAYKGGNPDAALRRYIAPNFDFTSLAAGALGRDWRNATPTQKSQFTEEFTKMLIRKYGDQMAKLAGGSFEYNTPRSIGGGSPAKVEVRTTATSRNGTEYSLDYMMYEGAGGQWKVYGMSIEGISIANFFRAQFQRTLERGGLDALIEELAKENGSTRASFSIGNRPVSQPHFG